ncbi:hypothetical protein F5Y09DRAFT_255852 [Xylaria sp. FL1042]|nr:hypothetical protein F5Y09DRAFT_255852 [Xylaria sp. FL1042]
MTGQLITYLVLGNLLYELEKSNKEREDYTAVTDTLSAEGRARKQPATAMMTYKLGHVSYRTSQYSEAVKLFCESIALLEP